MQTADERFVGAACELHCKDDRAAFMEKLPPVAQNNRRQFPKREEKPNG